jgi:lipopolysaccharide transport system ATP-binding protein
LVKLLSAELKVSNSSKISTITVSTSMVFNFEFYNFVEGQEINLSLLLYTASGNCIFNVGTPATRLSKGMHKGELIIPGKLLNDDIYTINLLFVKDTSTVINRIPELLTFEVLDEPREGNWYGKWLGAIRPSLEFSINKK